MVCPDGEEMDEPDRFTYPDTSNPEDMLEGSTTGKWFSRTNNVITVEPDFNAPYFRLIVLRFTVKNVFSVTVRIYGKTFTQETVSLLNYSTFSSMCCECLS